MRTKNLIILAISICMALFTMSPQLKAQSNPADIEALLLKERFRAEYEKQAMADSIKNAEQIKVKDAELHAQHMMLKQEKMQRTMLLIALPVLLVMILLFVFLLIIGIKSKRTKRRLTKVIEEQKMQIAQLQAQIESGRG